MARPPRVRIDTTAAETRLRQLVTEGLDQGAQYVVGFVKVSINRSNADGSRPSKPGEPPKKVTGTLQKSIAREMDTGGKEVIARIGTNVPYARHLEYGTSRMAARPFLRPALEQNIRTVASVIAARIRRG